MTPTPQQIVELAREAGIEVHERKEQARIGMDALLGIDSTPKLQRFATLLLERYGQQTAVVQEPYCYTYTEDSEEYFASPLPTYRTTPFHSTPTPPRQQCGSH